MAEDPYGYRSRDPVQDRDNESACVNMAFFPVLFNDAHSCLVYTASVTEECGALVE
jgi:hypothetical protein